MRFLIVVLLSLSTQTASGQVPVYTSVQVDEMAYLPEDAVKIDRSIRKKRIKKGLPASTPEIRFLQLFYSTIRAPKETRLENVDYYKVEVELLVDETGKLSVGDLYYLQPGDEPKLPPPLFDAPILITVFNTGGAPAQRHAPRPSNEVPEWSKGQLAMAVSIYRTLDGLPEFVPAQLDGKSVSCKWTLHVEYKQE